MVDLSIVICTRNRADRLAGVLDSLTKVKTHHRWEIVIIDNASTDETAAIIHAAKQYLQNLRYFVETQVGLGAARHRGWQEARASLVAFTDDDCYVNPDFVDAVVKVFTEYPDVGCVGGRILLYDPEDAPITIDTRDNPVEIPPRRFVRAGVMHGANLSFRRSTLETIGGFDPHLGAGTEFPCEDIDAIAATLWSGSRARFDPRPIVYHHHGRRAKDVPALMAGYAKGRGAYYAKYVFRPDTRWLYTLAWLYVAYESGDLLGLRGELQSARRYARQRGHNHSAMLTLITIAALAAFVAGKTVAWAKRKFALAKQVATRQIL